MAIEQETWQANGRVVLKKYDRSGNVHDIMVNKGRKIQMSAQERMLNQDYCIDETLDPFVNGTLSAVRLPETEDETLKALVENPNTMNEDDIRELVTGHHATFDKRMKEVTSPYVVRRMIAMVEEEDLDISTKRFEALETKLRDLTSTEVPVVEHERVQPS